MNAWMSVSGEVPSRAQRNSTDTGEEKVSCSRRPCDDKLGFSCLQVSVA